MPYSTRSILRAMLLMSIAIVMPAGLFLGFIVYRGALIRPSPTPAPGETAWYTQSVAGVALRPPPAAAQSISCEEVSKASGCDYAYRTQLSRSTLHAYYSWFYSSDHWWHTEIGGGCFSSVSIYSSVNKVAVGTEQRVVTVERWVEANEQQGFLDVAIDVRTSLETEAGLIDYSIDC